MALESLNITGFRSRTMLEKLKNLFLRSPESPDGEELVMLVSVARENPDIRQQLISVLSQEDFQRASLLNTWLTQLRLQQAPQPIITAIHRLTDPQVAERTLELISA
ncbi:MAG: hypothetical protein KDI36_03175 [Pseudomonadales bacterium]|nr:hypothetical protein [Pseudomonadales bacterium]